MSDFLTAVQALCTWQVAAIVVPCLIVTGFVLWGESRDARRPSSDNFHDGGTW